MEVAASVLATSASAIIGRSITHPLDTIRTRVQAGLPAIPSTSANSAASLPNTLQGLYRGWSVVVRFSIPGLSVFLGGYDASKYLLDKHTNLKSDNSLNHMASGLIAQQFAHLIFAPMELFKTVYQTSTLSKGVHSVSLTSLIRQVYQLDGIRGIYRGGLLGMAVYAPHNILYFGVYEKFKSLFSSRKDNGHTKQLSGLEYLISSSAATGIGAVITHPIEVIKTRYQVANTQTSVSIETPFKKIGLRQLVGTMYSTYGLRVFYSGLVTRICWMAPNTAMSMSLYELFKPKILNYLQSSTLGSINI